MKQKNFSGFQKRAKIEAPKSSVLIISDLHLSSKPDLETQSFLLDLIEPFSTIIVNGDLWDYFLCPVDEFMMTWNKFLHRLSKKNTIYITGNHDHYTFLNERVFEFAKVCCEELLLEYPTFTYAIRHGHQHTDLHWAEKISFGLFGYSLGQKEHSIYRWFVRRFGKSTNQLGHYFGNNLHKTFSAKKYKKSSIYYVCGHTHYPEYSIKKRYFNSGFIMAGHSSYLEILPDGKPRLHEVRYG